MLPVQIAFRGMEKNRTVDTLVRRKTSWLGRYFPRLTSCRVMVEAPHRRGRTGSLYHVRLDLTLPGGEIVVRRDPPEHAAHEDLRVAIRDAFDAARRQLMDDARRRRGQVKGHEGTPYGRVTRLFPEGFGFLETEDGREIYFHGNSVLDGFDQLKVGSHVRFAEERGNEGPQASTIVLAGRRRREQVVARR
jgi:cold shock CspA family protein